MNSIERLLEEADEVLLIDWPGEDCPRSMLRAGFTGFGQEPSGWLRYELNHRQLQKHSMASPPAHADLVFCYRPVEELPDYWKPHGSLVPRFFGINPAS